MGWVSPVPLDHQGTTRVSLCPKDTAPPGFSWPESLYQHSCFKAKYDHPPNPERFQWCTNKRDCICLTFPSHFLDEVAYAVLLLLTLVSSKCRAFCSLRKRKITGQHSQRWCKCTPGPPHARVTGPREDVHSSPTLLIILWGSKMQKIIEFVFLFFFKYNL